MAVALEHGAGGSLTAAGALTRLRRPSPLAVHTAIGAVALVVASDVVLAVDGERTLAAVFHDGEDQIATFTLAVMNADGSDHRTVLRLGGYEGDLDYAQFSPDGRRLVFEQNNSPLGRPSRGRAVFVVNVDGTGLHRITPWQLAAGDGPDWSPDGKLLLFSSHVDIATEQSQLYLVRPDGTGLKQITHFKPGTTVTSASFSPDGRWITFGRSGVAGQADVFIMRVEGTSIRAAHPDEAPGQRTRLGRQCAWVAATAAPRQISR
jgi:Tol biopolymer transport system component